MTLTRGEFVTYDYDRMRVMFTMTDGQTIVPCAISTDAMDVLDRSLASKSPAEREAQFMKLRDEIESRAAAKYLEAGRGRQSAGDNSSYGRHCGEVEGGRTAFETD